MCKKHMKKYMKTLVQNLFFTALKLEVAIYFMKLFQCQKITKTPGKSSPPPHFDTLYI